LREPVIGTMRGRSILAIAIIAVLGVAAERYELFPFKLVRAGYSYFQPFKAFPGRADIVMLGDSITRLGRWERWDDIFAGRAIANRGISGDTIEEIRARVGAVIQMNPHKVFIMGGINNLIKGSSAEQVFPIYADAVRALRSAGSQVFVQSTLLTAANYTPVVNPEVRKLNDRLLKFCSVEQVCTFVDLNARLAPDGYLTLTSDGLHLNPAGYAKWRDEIAPDME